MWEGREVMVIEVSTDQPTGLAKGDRNGFR